MTVLSAVLGTVGFDEMTYTTDEGDGCSWGGYLHPAPIGPNNEECEIGDGHGVQRK